MTYRLHRPIQRSIWLALLCALVLVQSLGLLHRVAHFQLSHSSEEHHHADQLHTDHVHVHGHGHGHGHDGDTHSTPEATASETQNWLSTLFSHDAGQDCRLIDGVSTFDALIYANVSVIWSLVASIYIAFSRITATARAAALYDARGPPTTL
jgi:ABC-type Zn2+ transport system substrate-binding protein/surface adhesin